MRLSAPIQDASIFDFFERIPDFGVKIAVKLSVLGQDHVAAEGNNTHIPGVNSCALLLRQDASGFIDDFSVRLA
ncbi:hypothetical protein [Pelagimonas phthalicica]|uniref:hypothetical protein n=1 Tax=Pelagimonas phthalicica TaxID=1037362 RepID=UPI00105CAA97|nr:hypothetical protein [Pelagimonas phthalicica]